ncbi:MAG: hypothetical protein K2J15_01500, partial [Muribaculaceae bacterium]|nr:hypothetical protein [Muribaculaceae bacterium]
CSDYRNQENEHNINCLRMKKLFFIVASLLPLCVVNATEYDYLAIRRSDGTETIVKSSEINMNVTEGKLIVRYTDGTSEFLLSDLLSMAFMAGPEKPSGIEDIYGGEDSAVEIYDWNGVYIGRFISPEGALEIMIPGSVYVIRNEKGTVEKLIRK